MGPASLGRLMPRRPILALGLLLAVIPLAGCGSEDPELIPQTRASALTSTIDEIKAACDDNDPAKAKAAVEAANQQVSELPRRVDSQAEAQHPRLARPHREGDRRRLQGEGGGDSDADAVGHGDATPEPTETPTPEPTETPTRAHRHPGAHRDGHPLADGGTSGRRRCPCA